jgi:hypothetical protein
VDLGGSGTVPDAFGHRTTLGAVGPNERACSGQETEVRGTAR